MLWMWMVGMVVAQEPPVDPEVLSVWWKAAGQLRLGDTPYRIGDSLHVQDGVCGVSLQDGVIIPVYTGTAPVSERMVGFVFIGDGRLALDFPERADAWAFANHMTRFTGKSIQHMQRIALQTAKYTVSIEQGLILSADPQVEKYLLNLEPVGGGVVFTESSDGEADATYIVTERRGKLQAKMIATNILADRSDALQRLGLDPKAMLRQDRLLHEELGFPGEYLRFIADYQTTDRFHVASPGTSVADMDYDRWLTCYRDGRDEAGLGYRSMAFSHGTDGDKRLHFQRWSGENFPSEDNLPRPAVRMEAVNATATVEFTPTRNKLYQEISVDSVLTFQAQGTNLQYIPLRFPTQGAERGSWVLEEFSLADGSPVAWVGLHADLADTGGLRRTQNPLQEVDISNQQVGMEDLDSLTSGNPNISNNSGTVDSTQNTQGQQASGSTSGISATNPQSISTSKIDPPAGPANFRLSPTDQIVAQAERTVARKTEVTYDVIALLPKPIAMGETVQLHLRWKADWAFANYSSMEIPDGVAVRSLGTTTGMHPIFPEILPLAGGTRWDYTITSGTKSPLLRPQYVVSSGDTKRTWQDEGLWNWVESYGSKAIAPAVGLGRWEKLEEPPAQGYPGVQVSLFPNTYSKAKMFAPEIRRELSFFQEFLPKFVPTEIDVVQNRSLLINEVNRRSRGDIYNGIVEIQMISPSAVGLTNDLREEDSKRAQTQIARQLAGQYWGQRIAPNAGNDVWITTALADAYAAYYIRAAFGVEEYEKRMTGVRTLLENPEEKDKGWTNQDAKRRTYSPAGATKLSDVPLKFRQDYALFVLGEMLRLHIGNEAYFSALEKLAIQDRVSSKSLQRYFEQSSNQDLSDFFDYWIYGGYIPKITLEAREDQGEIFACVHTDIPFGSFDTMVRIELPNKTIDTVVSINQGSGSFVLPTTDKVNFVVDPLFLVLAFERSVQWTKAKTVCEQK